MVLVEVSAAGCVGVGWTYGHTAAALLIDDILSAVVRGRAVADVAASWSAMVDAIRNLGHAGVGASAVAAVDTALWDLKARVLGIPLADLLGRAVPDAAVYGSGGFTSYGDEGLRDQLGAWAGDGFGAVKLKVGRQPHEDVERVRIVRQAVGPDVEIYVDANGAYGRKQALAFAEDVAGLGVTWFEEPVSSDDLDGLRFLRARIPAGMDVAAGEYGSDSFYFRRMLDAGAVDVLQADVTRCAGITGFLHVAALAAAASIPLSAHTSPTLHIAPCCAAAGVKNIEWFHDHVRIEGLVLDGAPQPVNGRLAPDPNAVGIGVDVKWSDIDRWVVWSSQ